MEISVCASVMIIKTTASSDASTMAPAVIKATSGSHHLSKKQKHRRCREKRTEGAADMPGQRWDIGDGTLATDSEERHSRCHKCFLMLSQIELNFLGRAQFQFRLESLKAKIKVRLWQRKRDVLISSKHDVWRSPNSENLIFLIRLSSYREELWCATKPFDLSDSLWVRLRGGSEETKVLGQAKRQESVEMQRQSRAVWMLRTVDSVSHWAPKRSHQMRTELKPWVGLRLYFRLGAVWIRGIKRQDFLLNYTRRKQCSINSEGTPWKQRKRIAYLLISAEFLHRFTQNRN